MRNDLSLVIEYLDDEYAGFQTWLESKKEIEGTEAELILANMEALRDVLEGKK